LNRWKEEPQVIIKMGSKKTTRSRDNNTRRSITGKSKNTRRKYPLTLRGRTFTRAEVLEIQKCVKNFFNCGRTRISMEVCRRLCWQQPNGWPKDRACRDVLVKLEKAGLVRLPERRKGSRTPAAANPKLRTRFSYKQIVSADGIALEFAKGNAAEKIWNALVSAHHYLGHRIIVGRCLKYLIKYRGVTAGAIAFSSSAWRVETRDKALREMGVTSEEARNCVINNSRFLILGTAQVRNFASQVLSLSTRQVAHDWAEFYSVKPVIVETFVLPSKFNGTCYKAANWVEVGLTKGYAKRGTCHVNSQEPKRVFLYGLNRKIRKKLLRVKPE
jgi:hypothetical protein